MNRGRSLLLLVLLSSFLAAACHAVNIDLLASFPRGTNGENNIILQCREDGEYHGLIPMGNSMFAHPGSPSTVPYAGPVISRGTRGNLTAESYKNPDRIYIRPSMEKPSGTGSAGVIRILPPLPEGHAVITGEAGTEGPPVLMAIYHGEANYDTPVWTLATPGRFEVNFTFTGSEPVFLAVSAPGNDSRSKGYWKDVLLSFTDGNGDTYPGPVPPSGVPTAKPTGTQGNGSDSLTPYLQSLAVIVAALISSVTAIWVAKQKKE